MQIDRYQRPGAGPGSLAAAVTLTGAMVLGLMSSAPETFMPKPIKDIIVTAIPLDPPPPERDPPPQPKREPTVQRPADARVQVAERPALPTPNEVVGTVEVTRTASDPGPVGPTVPADPPAALPIMVAAAIDARYARDFQPPYPPSKERAGEEGRITVRVLIGIDGRVRQVEPVGAVDDAFFAATRRQALARWRFTPATRDGAAHESWHTMSVRFQLTD